MVAVIVVPDLANMFPKVKAAKGLDLAVSSFFWVSGTLTSWGFAVTEGADVNVNPPMDTVAAAALLLLGVLGTKLILGVLSKGALVGAAGVAGVAGSAGVAGDDTITEAGGVEGTFELGAENKNNKWLDSLNKCIH